MNPKAKKLWLEALRSGEFQQGMGSMRNRGKHCCLGVLQEVAIKEGVRFEPDWEANSTVPDEVEYWAKLDIYDQESLANLNDEGATFDEIAACIEHGL
jgi:hypothetical protein